MKQTPYKSLLSLEETSEPLDATLTKNDGDTALLFASNLFAKKCYDLFVILLSATNFIINILVLINFWYNFNNQIGWFCASLSVIIVSHIRYAIKFINQYDLVPNPKQQILYYIVILYSLP